LLLEYFIKLYIWEYNNNNNNNAFYLLYYL
ncbi:hypothetical protein, partial [Plasmodium yoelii yoelii]